MKVLVKGVTIELTPDQINHVESEIAKRQKQLTSFDKVLKHFGFRKLDTRGWVNPHQNCYDHQKYGWFAEILDYGKWKSCNMLGEGLDSGHPWGKQYDFPESLSAAIAEAIDILENK